MLIGFIDEPGIAMVAMSESENEGDKHPIVKAKVTYRMDEKNEGYALIDFIVLLKDDDVTEHIKNLANAYKVSIMRELSSVFVASKLRYEIEGKQYHFVKKLGEKENLLIPIYQEQKPEEEVAVEDVKEEVTKIETVEAEECGIISESLNITPEVADGEIVE
ncbi:hypothetical protein M0R36_11205 [bacterium]|jgi:hypothetical protein|nr:hypothetical protein [bacterium]